MGLLTAGQPLSWEETKVHAQHVREHGIEQFLNLYRKLKDKTKDHLLWGDEIEYTVVKFDHVNRRATAKLCATKLLPILQARENEVLKNGTGEVLRTLWRPEYAEYMVEGTPGAPYGHLMAHFNTVEANMRLRREEVQRCLGEDELILSITAFPRLGCPLFTDPPLPISPTLQSVSESLFFPDAAICQIHPRFATLTRNIRQRRGEKVAINIPLYKDKNTMYRKANEAPTVMNGHVSNSVVESADSFEAALPGHVYMDAMGFGMGCCCLQMTFQASSVDEARHLYDQLTCLCPIVMCLSAATPVIRGFLTDNDCRWDIVSQAVDDRTREERGLQPLKENRFVIPKSRYGTVSTFISPSGAEYNDIDLVKDDAIYKRLLTQGVDHLLARHLAHLFIRDPVSLFQEKLNVDDSTDSDHFENIQSTNWQSMRFKPPPPNSDIGWRVEFRPTEAQITDFENAAYATFIVLLTRVIVTMKLNFLLPISKVDANFATAMRRDAVRQGQFFFRRGDLLTTRCSPPEAVDVCEHRTKRSCSDTPIRPVLSNDSCYDVMSVNTIINGDENFPGLIPLIKQYLRMVETEVDTACTLYQYLNLISKRASGELETTASWMRSFITNHPSYAHDSRVNEEVNYDLLQELGRITAGISRPTSLLPQYKSHTREEPSASTMFHEQQLDQRRSDLKMQRFSTNPHGANNSISQPLLEEEATL